MKNCVTKILIVFFIVLFVGSAVLLLTLGTSKGPPIFDKESQTGLVLISIEAIIDTFYKERRRMPLNKKEVFEYGQYLNVRPGSGVYDFIDEEEKIFRDAWGREIEFKFGEDSIVIRSPGADGILFTEDDVVFMK